MNRIELVLPRGQYVPGEEIVGTVFLVSDEKIECRTVNVMFNGLLATESKSVAVKGGKSGPKTNMVTHREERIVAAQNITLAERNDYDPGTHRFDFRMRLPENLESTYEGMNGKNVYMIKATAEINSSELVDQRPLGIQKPFDESLLNLVEGLNAKDEDNLLEIKVDSGKYCIGKPVEFHYRINADKKFSAVRIELIHREATRAENYDWTAQREIYRAEIPGDRVQLNEWNKSSFMPLGYVPPTFRNDNIITNVVLKVTLTRRLAFDVSAEILLVSGYCVGPKDTEKDHEGVAASHKEPAVKRIRCPVCSYTFVNKDPDGPSPNCPSCGRLVRIH